MIKIVDAARARMISDATAKAHQIACMTIKDLTPQFRGEKEIDNIVKSIKKWFDCFPENGKGAYAVIGMSGGKDSAIAAALCAKALGPERVYGLLMPKHVFPTVETDKDYADAIEACEYLGIKYKTLPIGQIEDMFMHQIITNVCDIHSYSLIGEEETKERRIDSEAEFYPGPNVTQNIPPRIRMTILYAFAAGLKNGGRVINTSNFSESFIGYCTKYGDTAGDFSPLGMYTSTEVVAIGDLLGLPEHLVHKAPADGLCGKTDEENLGFSYESLDKFIKEGTSGDEEIDKNIERRFINNIHKMNLNMPTSLRERGMDDDEDDIE